MKIEKSYEVSPELKAEVEKTLAEYKEKYKLLDGIVWESQIDAGAFFEHELEEED